jgi:hypothetical protein
MTSTNGTFRRTRAEVRERIVPVTIGGHTEMVPEKYQAHVPIPPRDWDRILLGGVTTATAALLALSVAWSTSSVGSLLARAVEPAVAYGAATAFDLVWIVCMAVEWLNRYNPAGAVLPRKAGHAALALAMGAVSVNGFLAGGARGIAIGIVGAAVSALAKGAWTIVMRHTAKPLNHLTQGWVDRRMSEAGGRLALAAVERQLARIEAQSADMRAALPPVNPDPDRPSGQPDTSAADIESAVHAALATMPDATPEAIVDQLGQLGITTDADTVRRLSGQPDSRSATLLQLADHRGTDTLSATVRLLAGDGITDPDTVLALARWVHGPEVKSETVSRLINRFRPAG